MTLELYLASDHAGFDLKCKLLSHLNAYPLHIKDLGAYSYNHTDDYQNYAALLAETVQGTNNLGILICGSGQGMCMTANKFKGVYAALAWDPESARMAKVHLNANVLCIGARFVDLGSAEAMVDLWLLSQYPGSRHARRIAQVKEIEKKNMK